MWLHLAVLGLALWPSRSCAGAAATAGLEFQGRTYRAVIGPQGELCWLRLGAFNALVPADGRPGGSLGDPLPLPLTITHWVGSRLTARGREATVTYRLLSDRLVISVLNASERLLTYGLRLAPQLRVDGTVATAPWGASLRLSAERIRSDRDGWRVDCGPLDSAVLELIPDPGPARPANDAIWFEPRNLTPWSFVLHGRPPDVDLDGRTLSIPLLLANDSEDMVAAAVRVEVLDADEPVGEYTETLALPPRDLTPFDARIPTPPPGVFLLKLTALTPGGPVAERMWLAFAPESWPPAEAVRPVEMLSAIVETTPDDALTGELPPRWRAWRLATGGLPAGAIVLPPALAPQRPLVVSWAWPVDAGRLADLGLPALWSDRPECLAAAVRAALEFGGQRPLVAEAFQPSAAALTALAALDPTAAALWDPADGIPAALDRPTTLLGRVAPRRAHRLAGQAVDRIYTVAPADALSHFRGASAAWFNGWGRSNEE